jgi:hypothetical protein
MKRDRTTAPADRARSAGKARWGALALAALLAAGAGPSFAARSAPLVDSGRTQIVRLDDTSPVTEADVRRAIILGGQARGWTAIGEGAGLLTLQIDNDRHRLAVDVAYDAGGFEMKYKSSQNMNYKDEDGHPTIHPTALRWMSELNNAIHKAALTPRAAASH